MDFLRDERFFLVHLKESCHASRLFLLSLYRLYLKTTLREMQPNFTSAATSDPNSLPRLDFALCLEPVGSPLIFIRFCEELQELLRSSLPLHHGFFTHCGTHYLSRSLVFKNLRTRNGHCVSLLWAPKLQETTVKQFQEISLLASF